MSKAEGLRQGILKRGGVLRKIGGCIFKDDDDLEYIKA